jgi:hypothetical protein
MYAIALILRNEDGDIWDYEWFPKQGYGKSPYTVICLVLSAVLTLRCLMLRLVSRLRVCGRASITDRVLLLQGHPQRYWNPLDQCFIHSRYRGIR